MAFLKKTKHFFFWLAFAWGLIFLFVSDERAECTTAEVIFFLLEGENFPFFSFDADGQSGMSTDNTTQTEEKNTHLLFYFFSVFRYYAAL
jgi:hypothetical protein